MSSKYNYQTPLIVISTFLLLSSIPGVNAYYSTEGKCGDNNSICIGVGIGALVIAFFCLAYSLLKCVGRCEKRTLYDVEHLNYIRDTPIHSNSGARNTNQNIELNRTTSSNYHVVNMGNDSNNESITQQTQNNQNEIDQPPPPYIKDTNLPTYNNV